MAGVAHAPAMCDGAGNCPAGMTTNCDPFLCGATACKTTCSTSTADCTTNSYCAAPNCVAKKGLGAVCGAGEQCTTGICGGRCCTAPCTCPQPSPGNMFANAGFDSDVSSWDRLKSSLDQTTGIQWNSQDVDGCPFSGSVQEVTSGLGNPSQCVAVTPGATYTFGAWGRNLDGNAYLCELQFWSGANCTGTLTFGPPGIGGVETAWTFHSVAFTVPAGNVSFSPACESNINSYFDKLFLSTTGSF
jgi:hypothetical protein